MINKRLSTLFFVILCLTSCNDKEIEEIIPVKDEVITSTETPRLAFGSEEELEHMIEAIKSGNKPILTRSMTKGGDDFTSLIDDLKEKELSDLTDEDWKLVYEDEEELEYCVSDSIIADPAFASILNSKREVQVGDNVYRYFENGLAITSSKYVMQLEEITDLITSLNVTPENEGEITWLTENIQFIPYQYSHEVIDEDEEPLTRSTNGKGKNIKLKNGVNIPAGNIREVDYHGRGDGSSFHYRLNRIFGKNIVALKDIQKRRRMRLNFYDQDYYIYHNIGSEVKMQKRVVGIWWTVKAQEIYQGWSAVELEFKFEEPVTPQMPPNPVKVPFTPKPEIPSLMYYDFPFKKKKDVALIKVPLVNYNITRQDINDVFNNALKAGLKELPQGVKSIVDKIDKKDVGVFTVNDKSIYTIVPGDEVNRSGVSSLENKFHAKWLDMEIVLTFGWGNNRPQYKKVNIKSNKSTHLKRGTVYGAVKYNNKWVACRIYKEY